MSIGGHVVLLGDSIFDNARYVPGGPAVIEQVRRRLSPDWKATLLAKDGSAIEDIPRQLAQLEEHATRLFLSVGGNDALDYSPMIRSEPAKSLAQALETLGDIRSVFQVAYRNLLRAIRGIGIPLTICTIYDAIPGLDPAERTALALFNEAILSEASRFGVPVVDLRLVCEGAGDYARSSPIEPSVEGGRKIARVISRILQEHDFSLGGCRLWS